MLIKVTVLKKYYLEKLTVYKCAVRNWWTTDDVKRTASSSSESFSATDLNQQVQDALHDYLLSSLSLTRSIICTRQLFAFSYLCNTE